ncbi:Nitrous oxide reductase accessory protein [Methylocella tundrae]|uniref:FAD:protein FMN transferase n=1 Tax=Methylocella tundrae TaxID=227605 RepID=A0A4U8Z5Z3_METTU|nr:FAD:protein FMN transferase [Methylocella tundrae]VFU10962.1 Nitrous oxide reductase accessory protein [Methylocella tundrae]
MGTTRRRFIAITAAAGGLPLLPCARSAQAAPLLRVWTGSALGADATLQIHHPDPATADRLIAASLAEVERLERILSLYRADSALCRLNRDGVLVDPPFDLVRVLSESQRYGAISGGAFDVTVQPLWDLYAKHFSRPDAAPGGPASDAIAATIARVDEGALEVDPARLRLARPGMGITLNGIGQGYVTDRVVELLRGGGVEHALVDMGETRALGAHPDGGSWSVGLEDPRAPGKIVERIPLADRAVATSGGYGAVFDAAGNFNHIFEPSSGRTSWRWLSVSIEADTATEADALSTAFTVMPPEATAPVVRALGLVAHFVRPDGSRLVQRA